MRRLAVVRNGSGAAAPVGDGVDRIGHGSERLVAVGLGPAPFGWTGLGSATSATNPKASGAPMDPRNAIHKEIGALIAETF